MSDKLKPCPFCGAKARENWSDNLAAFSIECNTTEHGCHIKTPWYTTREKAIEKWNTRPIEDQLLEACLSMLHALNWVQHEYPDIFNSVPEIEWSQTKGRAAITAAEGGEI